jgi:hypothetical protein
MFKLEPLIALIVDFIRTLLIEVVSDRVHGLRFRPRLRGMKDVRHHLHRTTRRRLLNRLSTDLRR